MSQALLHALARPLGLRVGGLGCVAWRALTRTPTPSNKTALSCRAAVGEAVAVRWCSGPTTFRQHSYITGGREEDSEKDILGPQSLTPHQTDLEDTTAAQDFLLPSQEQRHQSDRLVDKIKECESVDDGLDVYRRHSEVMSARHYLALIRKLGDLVSNSPEEVALVHGQEEFRALCGQLFAQCRRMDVEELVYLLKHLSRLEVPPTSKLTQAVLQMIKNQINDLSIRHLIFLEFLLKKMSLTPLADALLTAIPILISNALATTQITDLFFSDLTQAFTICSQGQVTGAGVLLQEMYRRGSIRSVPLAMSVVWALTQLSSPRLQRKLLSREEQLTREVIMKECLEILAQETDALTPQQVESTLSKVSVGHDLGDRSCYNERFLHAAATAVCHHSMSFEKTAHAIRKTFVMNYLSEALVQYTVDLLVSRPSEVPEARVSMLAVIASIAASPLPKYDITAALDVIMTHKSLNLDTEDYYKKPLLVMALDLLSVGYLHRPLIDVLTSPDTLSMFMSRYSKDDVNQRRLLEVDQALGEVFSSPHRVPHTFLEPGRRFIANQAPSRSTLRAMLNQILPDTDCLASGVVTEGGTYIDHLLVLDGEGVPIKLRNMDPPLTRNPTITSLNLPPEATRIAMMDVGSSSAFRPTNSLKGPHRLRQAVLEAAGFKVVALMQSVIYQHHEEEKILYVKRELSEAGVTLS